MTVIIPIVFESLIVINGDMKAFGCKVLSEEYSKPSLIILTFPLFPIVSDSATIEASVPLTEFVELKSGTFLYPLPPETILILLMGPCALTEVVVYFNV